MRKFFSVGKSFFLSKKVLILFLILFDFLVALFVFNTFLSNKTPEKENKVVVTKDSKEVIEISGKELSFQELSEYFTNLAKEKGAEYAFDVLKLVSLPANTDLHLLGHYVGDVLFLQQGADGIKICTDDFRNACSHSIVVGLFQRKGQDALPEITAACKEAPGGKGAYGMCFHGLGHGILAALGYDFSKAAPLCAKTGEDHPEVYECFGGMVMEIVGGGGHDKNLWSQERPKYLLANDPFNICEQNFVPIAAKGNCYNYITPFLFEAVGGNIGFPSEATLSTAFKLCNGVEDQTNRDRCFEGFGKEFVGLANSRDIRDVGNTSDEGLEKIKNWCLLAESDEGINSCNSSALASLYWGGENDRSGSIKFCGLLDQSYQESCYQELINAVFYYIDDKTYRKDFCNEIPLNYHKDCQA